MSYKIILLDIFSYSCMNCLRSLKFIKKIYPKYKKYGLEIILIHPPEWEFEKLRENIDFAIKKYKITFPLIIDKDKKIIKKLKVNFWPTQILIKNRKILYKHVGEGAYKRLENSILKSLKLKSKKIFNQEPKYTKYPTFYLGKRKQNKAIAHNGWIQKDERLQSTKNSSSLTIFTKGRIINFVAESLSKRPIKVNVKLNNKVIKNLTINKPQLYNIIKLKNVKQQNLTLTTKRNLAVYSFSFQ